MESINNLLTDANSAHKRQLDEGRQLTSKWENTGLLEGIGNEYEKSGMAILLENQARQLIDENSKTGGSNAEEWSGVALPLVRRIFGEIAAKDFVSVQPMNLPSGLVFFLDFKYGTDKANTGFASGTEIMGNTSASGDATGGLYNGGKFGYSMKASTQDVTVTSASATWADVDYDASLSASVAAGTVYTVTATTSQLTRPDKDGVQAWRFISGSLLTEAMNLPAFTKLTNSDASVQFVLSTGGATLPITAGDAVGNTVHFYEQPTSSTRGDFEDTTGDTTDISIPEVNVELRSETIVAKTRKLKAVWSPEFAQDLNAYHSIDAEAELTSMLSEYISMEIDLEILSMLSENALTKEYWSATIGETHTGDVDGGENNWNQGPAAAAYNQGTWFQTLGTKIQKVSNQIHAKTMRGGANFLVCGPEIATILESIPGYAAETDGNQTSFAMGVQKVGALNNRFTVYKNPYIQKDEILLGFRGTQFLETGAVYAPYVPLIMTPLVYDPQNFTPRKGVMTRYAKKVVRPEFYGKVLCKDVTSI